VTGNSDLESAFDAALGQVAKCINAQMPAIGGESAESYLRTLEGELKVERSRALERGTVDRDWFQTTVRWLVEWVPETELALIASFGRIARAAPRDSG
jgi:hypothetical protein